MNVWEFLTIASIWLFAAAGSYILGNALPFGAAAGITLVLVAIGSVIILDRQ